jgi:hypothetical protein
MVNSADDRDMAATNGVSKPNAASGIATTTTAARRELPGVWFTPLPTLPWATAALERASAPFLLVGGVADRFWEGALARRRSPHLLEVEGADHNMHVPGPLTDSIAVLGRVVIAIEEFLDTTDWPGWRRRRNAGSNPALRRDHAPRRYVSLPVDQGLCRIGRTGAGRRGDRTDASGESATVW